jgi:hypothetical protein
MAKKSTVVSTLAALQDLITQCMQDADRVKKDGTAADNARVYIEIRALAELFQDKKNQLEELKAEMAYKQVPEAFEREHTKTLTLKEGYRITVQGMVRASTKSMEIGVAWMKLCNCGHAADNHDKDLFACTAVIKEVIKASKNGPPRETTYNCQCRGYFAPNAGLVKETINAQTLGAFAKSKMEEGIELPSNIFNVVVGSNATVTKV